VAGTFHTNPSVTITVGVWAFAGFENLTFLTREFRRPEC
jgi:amino acid transporter